jgi:diaminopimelate decarboxylase
MPADTPSTSTAAEILGLFPPDTAIDPDGELTVGGCRLADLAERWGTPLYAVAEEAMRENVRRYRRALHSNWPDSRMVFASKAFPCTAVYRLLAEEGLACDVASGGELFLALRGGFDPARIYLHGNAKSVQELRYAVDAGVGHIVIDSLHELERLEQVVAEAGRRQEVLIRVTPGVAGDTHEAISTGQADSKFGFAPAAAREAIARIAAAPHLDLVGLHFHIGSQLLELEPFRDAVRMLAALGDFPVYNVGGGLGVAYTSSDRPPAIADYVDAIVSTVHDELGPDKRLLLEPGRAVVANSAVTLYTVETVKRNVSTWVGVDGGMSDNLRPMLYGSKYEALVADRPLAGGGELCKLAGKHCESGDVIVREAWLSDPSPGDVIVTPVTGAYGYSLANNYNAVPRPPVIFCHDGEARVVVRRENYEDLAARDVV